jgi:hypothetical protein
MKLGSSSQTKKISDIDTEMLSLVELVMTKAQILIMLQLIPKQNSALSSHKKWK